MENKRFLSIRYKLLNPITIIFAVFMLLLYFGVNSLVNGMIAGIFEDEIFNVFTLTTPLHENDEELYQIYEENLEVELLEACMDAEDVAMLGAAVFAGESVTPSDARYERILECFNEVENFNPRAVLTTYYINDQNKVVIGVDSSIDDEGIHAYPFGTILPEDDYFIELMDAGYQEMTFEPNYVQDEDDNVYFAGAVPIKDENGNVVGGILVDMLAGETINSIGILKAIILIVGIVSFIIIAAIIYFLTNQVTSSIRKLAAASENIGKGDYEEVELGPQLLFSDEVVTLADRFNEMARQVYKREKELVEKVTRMKVFIDQDRRKEDLEEIVESDFFKQLREQKEKMNKSKMAETMGEVEE